MTKLHLDTDIGGDIDDLCALALVLKWPGCDLLAVTTNQDDGGRRAGYARYALDLAGRITTPVGAGSDISQNHYRMYPGLPDEAAYWPHPIPPAPTPFDQTLDLLASSIDQGATVVGIGTSTNLARLEERSPGILRRADLWLMGGYVYPPRPGFPQWDHTADWNVQNDIAAARLVFEHSSPTLIPLTVTVETALCHSHLPALRQGGPLAQLIARQAIAFTHDEQIEARFGATCHGLPPGIINFQHDPLACAIALGWRDGIEISELPLRIDIRDGWLLQVIDPVHGIPIRVVTRIDAARFNAFWLERVTS